jgi:short-subunit dehydrogenase
MSSNQTQTALITGASSGIGLELVRCFARDNFKIIMVARQPEKLQQAADKIRAEFSGVQIDTITCDLSQPGSPDQLFAETQSKNLQIDILVNNAGFGEHGFFAQTDLKKELELIQLNIASLTHLTKLYLPLMLNRRSGKILNVASEAAFMPIPLLSVYAASKAYVLSFSEALQNEIEDTGVQLTILCPAATDTNFFRVAGAENTKVANSDLDSPVDVAKAAYEGLMKGEKRILPTTKAKMHVTQGNLMPDSMLASLMRKQMEPVDK